MRTELRAQLHKPVKKIFSTHLGGAPAPGAPPCLRHWKQLYVALGTATVTLSSRATARHSWASHSYGSPFL